MGLLWACSPRRIGLFVTSPHAKWRQIIILKENLRQSVKSAKPFFLSKFPFHNLINHYSNSVKRQAS